MKDGLSSFHLRQINIFQTKQNLKNYGRGEGGSVLRIFRELGLVVPWLFWWGGIVTKRGWNILSYLSIPAADYAAYHKHIPSSCCKWDGKSSHLLGLFEMKQADGTVPGTYWDLNQCMFAVIKSSVWWLLHTLNWFLHKLHIAMMFALLISKQKSPTKQQHPVYKRVLAKMGCQQRAPS